MRKTKRVRTPRPICPKPVKSLLDKNNQGTITKSERAELERLVDKAEKVSLHNARAFVEYRRRGADRIEVSGIDHKRRSGKESEAVILD
jgi:hypothetical protein